MARPLRIVILSAMFATALTALQAQEVPQPQAQDLAPRIGMETPPEPEQAPALPQPDVAQQPVAPTVAGPAMPEVTEAQTPEATQPPVPSQPPAVAAPEAPAEGQAVPLPHDLSAWGMFLAAHPVVQAVMVLLTIASFLTWTVLLFKLVELAIARRRLAGSAGRIRVATDLAAAASGLGARLDPAAFMARAALEELQRSDAALDGAGPEGVKERVRSLLERVEVQAGERLRRGIGLLATIGSTAPFVGLFGTVWGIMNAFIGISESQTTNLAVVAPGIAEALLATAMGLVAAIPAVVIYNHFVRAIAAWKARLGDAGACVERLLSRDLDFRTAQQRG